MNGQLGIGEGLLLLLLILLLLRFLFRLALKVLFWVMVVGLVYVLWTTGTLQKVLS
ncbi:MAG: hypothetical protein L6E13_06875 [Firmicutes bacterium]|nr:hypothetical protein [Bacillota bacterium]